MSAITNNPNSFIRWNDPGSTDSCFQYNGVKLPIHYVYDFMFMFQVLGTSAGEIGSWTFGFVSGSGYTAGSDIDPANLITSLGINAYDQGDGVFLCVLRDGDCGNISFGDLGFTLKDGDCISLAILKDTNIQYICSQEFYYTSDLCFTEVIRYKCNDNAYGFLYADLDTFLGASHYNQARLPITLHSPQPITQKTGFKLSDGSFKTLAATKEEIIEVLVDYMDRDLHRALDCAIDHDFLYIFREPAEECVYTNSQFFHPEDDKYEVAWDDKPGNYRGIAQAKFKLKPTPFYSQNSNC